MSTLAAYTRTKSAAIAVLAEQEVDGTMVALLHMRKTGNKYLILTSGGGSQGAKSDRFIHQDFAKWVAAIAAR